MLPQRDACRFASPDVAGGAGECLRAPLYLAGLGLKGKILVLGEALPRCGVLGAGLQADTWQFIWNCESFQESNFFDIFFWHLKGGKGSISHVRSSLPSLPQSDLDFLLCEMQAINCA